MELSANVTGSIFAFYSVTKNEAKQEISKFTALSRPFIYL